MSGVRFSHSGKPFGVQVSLATDVNHSFAAEKSEVTLDASGHCALDEIRVMLDVPPAVNQGFLFIAGRAPLPHTPAPIVL